MSNIESGIGLVYWPGLEPLFEAEASALTSLEVEVEAFWFQSPEDPNKLSLDYAALQRIARLPQTKVIHGVGAALGTCATPNQAHLDAMCESIKPS